MREIFFNLIELPVHFPNVFAHDLRVFGQWKSSHNLGGHTISDPSANKLVAFVPMSSHLVVGRERDGSIDEPILILD